MSWTIHLTTDAHDEDYNRVIRASAILRYLQIAANTQLHECGPTTEELLAAGQAFLLSSIDMTFHRALPSYREIECTTWPCPARGFTFPRCYTLSDREGEAVRAVSQWALIDIASKNILRASDVSFSLQTEPPLETRVVRFTVPHISEMRLAGTYPVTYGQTDLNHHLNNTYYPDMFTSFVSMDARRVTHLGIRFLHEAPLGEVLSVYVREEGDTCRFVSVRTDGQINAEAEITFAPLEA